MRWRQSIEPLLRPYFHVWFRLSRGMTLGVRGLVLNARGEVRSLARFDDCLGELLRLRQEGRVAAIDAKRCIDPRARDHFLLERITQDVVLGGVDIGARDAAESGLGEVNRLA